MEKEEVHWWATTLEARRQLIRDARREGYLMAIHDLGPSLNKFKAAFDDLFKILKQMEREPIDPAP